MAVDPNLVAVVTWAGQLFLVLSGALILIGALTVISFFNHAKAEKKRKQEGQIIELLLDGKKNTDTRIAALEETVKALAKHADKEPIGDEDQKLGEG